MPSLAAPWPPTSRAFTGAWVETTMFTASCRCPTSRLHRRVPVLWVQVAPSQARGLKPQIRSICLGLREVAPSQARGLKQLNLSELACLYRRAFTGAWVETGRNTPTVISPPVAPSQARGLKPPLIAAMKPLPMGRAFTGAWVETSGIFPVIRSTTVAPSQARGLKPHD